MKYMTKSAGAAMVFLALLLAGCNKNEVHQGGEGTSFPYTWQEQNNGSVVVKLDGSHAPDYGWTAENSDGTILQLEEVGKEKNGIVSYRVKPLAEGTAAITFTRMRELPADLTGQEDASENDVVESVAESQAAEAEAETAETAQAEAETVEKAQAEAETAETAQAEAETAETAQAETQSTDAASEEAAVEIPKGDNPPIALPMETERMPGGIRGSYSADVTEAGDDGLSANASHDSAQTQDDVVSAVVDETDYDWMGLYQERLKPKDIVSEIVIQFEVTPTGKKGRLRAGSVGDRAAEYKGLIRSADASLDYKLWDSDRGTLMVRIPFEKEPRVVKTTEGSDEILSVVRLDGIAGDECYEIQGLTPGNVTVEFISLVQENKLLLELTVGEDSRITVLSHGTAK